MMTSLKALPGFSHHHHLVFDVNLFSCRRGNKDQEKVFEEELKKHDKMVAFIKQNIAAQENIIRLVSF